MAIVKLTPRPDLGEGYFDEIEFGAGSPPDRPHPQPPLGFWGPGDPRPTNPITGLPGYKPPLGPNRPGTRPPEQMPTANALVIPLPKTDPPTPPPGDMPADSSQILVWFGPGTLPALGWVGPYASTGPVTPPAEAPEAAPKY